MIMPAIVIDVPTFEPDVVDVCLQSEEVNPLKALYADTISHYTDTNTTSKKTALYKETESLCENVIKEGRDNLKTETFINAIKLILALPANTPNPEIEIDSDGELSFEWYINKTTILFVTVSPEGRLSYAGRFENGSKAHGQEWIKNGQIPKEIIYYVSKLS